ncbi:MAG TPA: bifunctional UDP-N-acetylmuramoyl-tripeptide:D-alanyl-D-alanine ligase/alanine racemase, partial [Chitinophagaceae bacterium]|nr:bifunctional UDP-N-acetylmuramoyl-tripeptide:D-alanyl-D-alanine ligase/alanine racemase [Chitinophagaceae bacterium]
ALKGPRRNGHSFVAELYKKGVRNFIVSETLKTEDFSEANFLFVDDCLKALQDLAAFHREQFSIPVIGITGSNGKTIVKEWLYQLLYQNFNIVRSPKSYNSQIGVPLSIWEMNKLHTLGIFEAGISKPREMDKLNGIIQPTIGILTNIGEAHSEGFESMDQKVQEKIKLFKNAGLVIYCSDEWLADKAIVLKHESVFHKTGKYPFRIFSWGKMKKADLQILEINKLPAETEIIALYKNAETAIKIPFIDDASIQNAITCWCVMLHFGFSDAVIAKRMKLLQPVIMRLELKKGINHCTIINDSYSADLNSLHIALDFLKQMGGGAKKTVILSDFFQTGMDDQELYGRIAADLNHHKIDHVIGIGLSISKYLKTENDLSCHTMRSEFYSSTEDFISRFRFSDFRDETILVKGARIFCFEQVIQLLELKVHQTELEINLNAVAHNLQQYQRLLQPSTKLMAMVKAFAYGSGGAEIANTLQFHKVDYLGVAYADEGMELRKAGIALPMMVMNAEKESFEALINNQLEPVLFSFTMLKALDGFLKREGIKNYPVHLEIETGMNRLGFAVREMGNLCREIKASSAFRVQSVFSHLAASEDPMQDEFTNRQYDLFIRACTVLQHDLGYSFLRHIANSAAIFRHPQMQLDMVRLGIGLYGVDSAVSGKLELQPVATLKSTIAQIRHLKAGETVGYNRKGVIEKDAVIATVSIGYADGFDRKLGNGGGKIWVKGQLAPVIGTVCMDMTMIDVTEIPGIKQGDEVIIFGKELPIQDLANWAGTIPYEIMTGISQRVKRVYYEE